MAINIKTLLATAGLIASTTAIEAQQLAFPGAYGWGRFALGARGSASPTVYHVTNLNDSGAGSLRDAVSQPNRIVVFDVSGVIKLNSRMTFKSNLYIAGQTAPGEGITLYGNGVSFSGANNLICRYLRVRMGHGGDSGKDCAGVANGTNMIFDHCSFSWGLDENFSINSDGKGALGNITLQNSIIGQGLMTHSAGGLMQADSITLYRNFYCDNSTRNNKVKGINQYANNIVYNWKNGCYIMGGDSEGTSYVNIESNLFVNGPAQGGSAFGGGNERFHFYGNDNWQDSNLDGKLNPSLITSTGGGDQVATRYPYPDLELYNGQELIEKNIPTVGASLPYRDQADCYMVDELLSYGKKGNLITFESSLPIGTPNDWSWWQGEQRKDTDGDGMPDDWEIANGTNPNANDATVKAANGYLNIENYINSIDVNSRQYFLRQPVTLEMKNATTTSINMSWRDYTYEEEGFAIEMKQNGTWTEIGRTAANKTEYNVSNLEPGTSFTFRVRAFAQHDGSEVYSDYSKEVVMDTRPMEIGIVDIDTYEPDVTLGDNQTVWDETTTEWKEGKAYVNDNKVLLNTDNDRTLTIQGDITPASIVVNGKGDLTLVGNIMGEGSMNKANTGTLVLNDLNTYTGATVNHEGVIEFNTLKNGDVASSLGASRNYAQNWIFDGGTYRYTGATTSTDRSAQIKRESTLEIANAVAVTMGGTFEGNGNFVLDGKGTLNVGNSDFFGYSGATILKGGVLNLTDIEKVCKTFSSKVSKIVLAGGHLKIGASKNEDYQTYSSPIEVVDGTTSQYTVANSCYVKNTITGNGTLQINVPYVRAYISSNMTNFTGMMIGNGTNSDKSLFFHNSKWNAPKTRFHLKGKCYMGAWDTNASNTIGGLSGDAGTFLIGSSKKTSNFECTWTVGGANSDETFKGIINNMSCDFNERGKTNIVKVGTGIWRLMGSNIYKGTTKVEGGKLIVNGTNSGTGAYTINADATLAGKGTVKGAVTCASGGYIEAGDTLINKSTLKLSAGLKMNSGAILQVNALPDGTTNYVNVTGTMTIGNAVLYVNIDGSTSEIADSTEFKVMKATTISGTFAEIIPAQPAENMIWDTSRLYTEGILLSKAIKTGILSPESDRIVSGKSYNLAGQQVSSSYKGIVIRKGKKVIMK